MKIKIVRNTVGDECWYRNRIGEVFEAKHHHVLGMAFMDMGDWNVGKQDGTGKDCLVAGEDAEIVGGEKMTLTYPVGEYNQDSEVEATEDGIEIEWIGTIPWDWIDAAREKFLDVRYVVSENKTRL